MKTWWSPFKKFALEKSNSSSDEVRWEDFLSDFLFDATGSMFKNDILFEEDDLEGQSGQNVSFNATGSLVCGQPAPRIKVLLQHSIRSCC